MRFRIAAVLAVLSIALTGCVTPPRHALDLADRSPAGGREVVVLVPQGEIRGEVAVSNAGAGFGLIGALIDTGVNQHRTSKAEEAITPVRDALTDYNFDQQALDSTQAALPALPWLEVKKISLSKDNSSNHLNEILDKSGSPEVLFAVYDYALVPDFSALQVTLRVTICPRAVPAGKPPKARIELSQAAYEQDFTYVVPLTGATKDLKENAQRWANVSGSAARLALNHALTRLSHMVALSLQQSPEELAKLSAGKLIKVGGTAGIVVEQSNDGTLIMQRGGGGWVFMEERPAG
jgi:hypothetical protein